MLTKIKVQWLALAASIVVLYSCETQPDVPLVPTAFVATTTTTTVRPPVMIISQPPATTTTTTTTIVASLRKPILPSISESEYRNLFATVRETFREILLYEIDALLPKEFAQASTQFQSAEANYETQIWRWPYDGEAAFPFSGDLRNSGKSLLVILEKGLSLRSDIEKTKARTHVSNSRYEDIPIAAYERLIEADTEFATGINNHENARYRSSIASFRRAMLLYESTDARARAEILKSKAYEAGYKKYSPYYLAEADRYLLEDASLYALSNNDAIARGVQLLGKASRTYENILAWGAEREAFEARGRALFARQSADWLFAELNATEDYSSATLKLSDAEKRQESCRFDEATALYNEAADAFEIARLASENRQYTAKVAFEMASQAVADQREKLKTRGFEEDVNFLEAEALLASADDKLTIANFTDSSTDSLEALNQIAVSENRFQALQSSEEAAYRAAEQSEIEKISAEKNAKAEADRLVMEARLRTEEAQTAAYAAELAIKSAELEILRSALARSEANMKAKAESDAAERAALERQIAEAQTAAQEKTVRQEAERLALESALREMKAQETERAAADRAEAERLATEKAAAAASALAAKLEGEEAAALQAARAKAAVETALRAEPSLAIDEAKRRYNWAVSKNAEYNYSKTLSTGGAAIATAEAALDRGDSEEAIAKAKLALSILSGIQEYAELPAAYIVDLLPERKDKDSFTSIAGAEYGYSDPRKWPILYEANKSILREPTNPHLLLSGQVIVIPSIRGEIRNGTWDPMKTYFPFEKGLDSETEILNAIDQARKAYDRAVARNAHNNYPSLLAEGAKDIEASRKAYDSGDSLTASVKAHSAWSILESIDEFAPLPAAYKIGMAPERKSSESLWNIAASPFGYNDPYKWIVLYKANKATLPNPSNPNLLKPGQIIVIPSIDGESREGLWNPKKTYPVFSKH